MAKKTESLSGKRLGKLLVGESEHRRDDAGHTSIWWKVTCDCGNTHWYTRNQLFAKKFWHCGCEPLTDNDLTGRKFGRLTCVRSDLSRTDKRGVREMSWWCLCECGKTISVKTVLLSNGTVKSCGCLQREQAAERMKLMPKGRGDDHPGWKGVGKMPGSMWTTLKSRTAPSKRNRELSITKEFLWELFTNQSGKCALTGVPLFFGPSAKDGDETTASVDRIDSNLGYTVENSQWVHKDINWMKQDFPEEVFISWCRKVVEHADRKAAQQDGSLPTPLAQS